MNIVSTYTTHRIWDTVIGYRDFTIILRHDTFRTTTLHSELHYTTDLNIISCFPSQSIMVVHGFDTILEVDMTNGLRDCD